MSTYGGGFGRDASVEVGTEFVTVREPSGKVMTARILERKPDGSVLCDRIVHEPYRRYVDYAATGAYVTEFVPAAVAEARKAKRKD